MGKRFWDEAEKAAGEVYGKANAAAYERREKFKRAVGSVLLGIGALYLAARTWGPAIWEATRVPLMYGAGALLAFIGIAGLTYVYVRARRTRVRTRELARTYAGDDW